MADQIDFSTATLASTAGPDTLELIFSKSKQVKFAKGQVIERHDAPAKHLSFIRSGLVRLGIDSVDGSRFNMSILGAGNTFGETSLFIKEPVRHDAHAETDVVLCRLTRADIQGLIESSPAFSLAMLTVAYARFRTALDYMNDVKKQPLEVRAAKIILDIYNNSSSQNSIECKQIDLAHALSVSRVSIGKALKSLHGRSLIIIGYGKLTIPSAEKLIAFIEQSETKV